MNETLPDNQPFDVLIVGGGPVGRCAALALGRLGHRVALVERRSEPYTIPRACFFDHEIARILHALGVGPQVLELACPTLRTTFFSQDWKVLFDTVLTEEAPSGGALGYTFYQPKLEAILDAAIEKVGSIRTYAGHQAVAALQDAEGCDVTVEEGCVGADDGWNGSGHTLRLRSRFVVGADGARSLVRREIGASWRDLGFQADWLVVDVDPAEDWTMAHLDPCQWCNPARPTTLVPTGRRSRRWEFMLMPGESAVEMQRPERVWELLSPWISPAKGQLIRHTVYRFRSLVSDAWQKDRIFLMGDAAHLMPPFLGQGMCSGIRDAWNLSWKLDLVLTGRASSSVLASYESERSRHVTELTQVVIECGRALCITDAEQARLRDEALLTGRVPPPPPMPPLREGVLAPQDPMAGQLSMHAPLLTEHGTIRLDELTGPRFTVLASDPSEMVTLSAAALAVADRLQMAFVSLAAEERDPSGRLRGFLRALNCCAVIVRPDYCLYGVASSAAELSKMVEALGATLAFPASVPNGGLTAGT